jgi:TatD DNase family protein
MFIDSHCHLNNSDFVDDLSGVLLRAKKAGVTQILTICTTLDEAEDVIEIARSHSHISCSVGVHPHDASSQIEKYDLRNEIEALIIKGKQYIVALGETGLDYYYDHSPRDVQRDAFRLHLEIAEKYDLPVIVHTRDAEKDTIDCLKEFEGRVRGVIHCFSGSSWLAKESLKLGFYISFSGIVTFKNADELRAIVKETPLERILIETDAPYLAPVPHRGKRNEPAFVAETAKAVADLKNVSIEELAKTTTQNCIDLFRLSSA